MSSKRKRRVLAIDDEPAMTEWLKILLEHEGYEVRTALIGTRGEEIFKTWRPDVVVTDMMLPDVDGIELLRKFKQTRRRHRGHRHHRPGQHPAGGRGGEGRRASLPREADRRRTRLLDMLEKAIEQTRPGRREPAAQAEARRTVTSFGNIIGKSKKMQELLRAGRERGGQRRQHPDPGRERHRQGADRQRASTTTASAPRARSSRSTARRFRRT